MLRLGTLLFISNSHCFRINKHVLEHDLTSFPTVLKKWSPLLNWARHSAVIQSMGVLMLASHCYCLVAKAYLTLATPWAVAHQALLSMGLPRQEYWSGLPFPCPGDLPNPGIKPGSPALQADALPSEPHLDPEQNLKTLH